MQNIFLVCFFYIQKIEKWRRRNRQKFNNKWNWFYYLLSFSLPLIFWRKCLITLFRLSFFFKSKLDESRQHHKLCSYNLNEVVWILLHLILICRNELHNFKNKIKKSHWKEHEIPEPYKIKVNIHSILSLVFFDCSIWILLTWLFTLTAQKTTMRCFMYLNRSHKIHRIVIW